MHPVLPIKHTIPMMHIARLMLAATVALTSLCVVAQDKKPDLVKGEASYTCMRGLPRRRWQLRNAC
jgi:hypothetical protein